jgi:hypothetical protein
MLEDGQYHETNFAIVVMSASRAGRLEDLVILKPTSNFHVKFDLESNVVVIVDKYKKFLDKTLCLVKIDTTDIQEEYLTYLARHDLDGTVKDKKMDVKQTQRIKSHIARISNIHFDTYSILDNKTNLLIDFLNENNIDTLQTGIQIIKEFLNNYGYDILHSRYDYINKDLKDISLQLSDSVGKFWIIKDEDKFLKVKSNKPLHIFSHITDIGYHIGSGGRNITKVKDELNLKNKHWNIPYIKVSLLDSRPVNNSYTELVDDYYKLLEIIFKDKNK